MILSAFDLEEEINSGGKIKAILKSDPSDVNSFANRLNDPRFGQLARFINLSQEGLKNLNTASTQQALIDKYLINEFEKDVGKENSAVREAFFFLRKINSIGSTVEILQDLPLRSIITSGLQLPPGIARQSVEKQISLIETKFNVNKASVNGTDLPVSQKRENILKDDAAKVEKTTAIVKKADQTLSAIRLRIKDVRDQLSRFSNVTSAVGINAAEIPVQRAAMPTLIRQSGLISAANDALAKINPIMDQLKKTLTDIISTVSTESVVNGPSVAELVNEFISKADKILGNVGLVNGASYTDTNTNLKQNLLRPSGDSELGITSISNNEVSTVIDSKNSATTTKAFDLSNFLSRIQAAKNSVASTTESNAVANIGAARAAFDLAKLDFDKAFVQMLVNKGSFDQLGSPSFDSETATDNGITFAYKLATQNLAKAISAVDDSVSRATTVEELLDTMLQQTKLIQTTTGDLTAIQTTYSEAAASLITTINTSGSVKVENSGALGSNPFTSTEDSVSVTVIHANHGLQAGDSVTFSGVEDLGGLDLNTSFTIASVNDANSYVISANSAATSSVSGGGGSAAEFASNSKVDFDNLLTIGAKKYDVISNTGSLANNPFTTFEGSAAVSVSHAAHGLNVDDFITFSGSEAVGGLGLSGEFKITSITNANSYVITAGSSASSSASGGGSSVTYQSGRRVQIDGGNLSNTIASAITASLTTGNAATIASSIENTFKPAIETVHQNINRQQYTINFLANVADPQGRIDGAVRDLATELNALVLEADVDGQNLIGLGARDIRVSLGSVGTGLRISGYSNFTNLFDEPLSRYSIKVLNGATLANRMSLLNDVLFSVGSVGSKVKSQKVALDIQSQILKSANGGGDPLESVFLKPTKNTDYAIKFIEKYLLTKDATAQGVTFGSTNANALLLPLIAQISPQTGININLLS